MIEQEGMVLGAVVSFLTTILIASLLLYARWNYGTLEKLGFPVLPPYFFLGSSPFSYKELSHIQDEERARKYGGVYGVYEGRQPKIYVNDPELVSELLVKSYEHFSDRLPWELIGNHPLSLGFLDFQIGETWKELRGMITSGMSIGRVKSMTAEAKVYIDTYFQDLIDSTKCRQTLNPRQYTSALIIDLSSLLYLGVRMGDFKDPTNMFIRNMRSLFLDSITEPPNFLQTIGYTFPFIAKYVSPGPFWLPFFPPQSLDHFVLQVKEVLKAHKERNMKENTFVRLFLEMIERTKSPEYKERGVTETHVMSQILELYLGSYEGLPTAVATFLYHIAKEPKAQAKLLSEVDELINRGRTPEREAIFRLPYLDACLLETFRIFPTFHRLDRVCTKDWEDKTRGIRIPKGLPISISLWPLHHSPHNFPQPHKFRPERFLGNHLKTRHPYAFGIFGHGPKSCPGKRLITDLLKLTLFKILTHFRLESTEAYEMNLYPGFGPFIRTNQILVDIIPRSTIPKSLSLLA